MADELLQPYLNSVFVDTFGRFPGCHVLPALHSPGTLLAAHGWYLSEGDGHEGRIDEFHADPGRMCVMLTRHRHACIVVGRAGDRVLVESIPPSTPAYLGDDHDPLAEGWRTHQQVFTTRAEHRVTV